MNLIRSVPIVSTKQVNNCRLVFPGFKLYIRETREMSTSEDENTEKDKSEESLTLEDLSVPTNCCMSGCMNCVWIQYAEKLSTTLQNSDVDMQKMIMDKIQDPNMKAFLLMELRCRNLIK